MWGGEPGTNHLFFLICHALKVGREHLWMWMHSLDALMLVGDMVENGLPLLLQHIHAALTGC